MFLRIDWEAIGQVCLSVLFPARCPYCGEVIAVGAAVCDDCAGRLPYIPEPACARCGKHQKDCDCKTKQPHRFYQCVAAPFYYTGLAKQAVYRLKFQQKPDTARFLGREMDRVFTQKYRTQPFDVVTAVPMTRSHRRKRGYNQAELLAKYIARREAIPYRPLLQKTLDVPPQHTMSADQRRGNVLGIYTVTDPREIAGKHVLLIDDVYTTGSTIEECAKILLVAGAVDVHVLCAAVTRSHQKKAIDPVDKSV